MTALTNMGVILGMIAVTAALVGALNLVNWIVERIRDRLHPERTKPVVFDRYKTKMYDQDEK